MKLLPLILILFVGCAAVPFESGSTADTARQTAFTALLAADWYQTRRIADDPNYYETNPVLGEQPSSSSVDLYMVGCAVGHAVVSGCLKPGKWREAWQYLWVGAEGATVVNNHRIGVR